MNLSISCESIKRKESIKQGNGNHSLVSSKSLIYSFESFLANFKSPIRQQLKINGKYQSHFLSPLLFGLIIFKSVNLRLNSNNSARWFL